MSDVKYEVGDLVDFYNDGIHGVGEIFRINYVYGAAHHHYDASYTVRNVVEKHSAPRSTCDVNDTWFDNPTGNTRCWNIKRCHILRLVSKAKTKKGNTVHVL